MNEMMKLDQYITNLSEWKKVIYGCVILICILFIFSPTSATKAPTYDLNRSACYIAKDIVKNNLKAPSTADFGECSSQNNSNQYIAIGTVDSQNSFGAMLRKTYTVTLYGLRPEGTNIRYDKYEIEFY